MRGTPKTYLDFSGGLNTNSAPYQLDENQARDCLNVRTSPTGAIKKREGFVPLGETSLRQIHSLFPVNTRPQSLLAAGTVSGGASDSIVKMSLAGTPIVLRTGLHSGQRWYWAQGQTASGPQGPIYGMNGIDTPLRWDGVNPMSEWTATTGTVPKGKFLTYHSARLWCAGNNGANLSRVFYSGITGSTTDPRNWDANNYVDLEPDDGQPITGIGTVGSYLIVFKARKIFVITDLVTGANRQLSSETGCIAHRTIIETNSGVFFLSEDQGVMVTDGSTVDSISDNITPTLRTVAQSPMMIEQACAAFKNERYYLSVSLGGARNDRILEYDLRTQSWWLHDASSNEFALIDPAGSPVLYSAATAEVGATVVGPTGNFGGTGNYGGDDFFGGSGGGGAGAARIDRAFVHDVFEDAGTIYEGGAFWTGPHYVWNGPHIQKQVREIRIDGVGEWDAYRAVDFQSTFSQLDGEVWESSSDDGGTFGGTESYGGTGDFAPTFTAISYRRYHTPGKGRAWSYKLINSDADDWEVFAITTGITGRTD